MSDGHVHQQKLTMVPAFRGMTSLCAFFRMGTKSLFLLIGQAKSVASDSSQSSRCSDQT